MSGLGQPIQPLKIRNRTMVVPISGCRISAFAHLRGTDGGRLIGHAERLCARVVPDQRDEGLAGIWQVPGGLQTIDDALAQCERTDERWNISELLRVKGELLLLEGAPKASAAAEDHYRHGLDWARRQGALSWELRVATSPARLLCNQNRSAEAITLLVPIYNRFTEGFETADLKAANALIDGFYNSKGTSRSPLIDASSEALAFVELHPGTARRRMA